MYGVLLGEFCIAKVAPFYDQFSRRGTTLLISSKTVSPKSFVFFQRCFVLLIFIFDSLLGQNIACSETSNSIPSQKNFHLPHCLGTPTEQFQGTKKTFVLHIQDLHCVASAQENIAQTIETFYKSGNFDFENPLLIAVEGASGPVSTSFLGAFPDEEGRKSVAHLLLKEGLLTGPESLKICHPEYPIHIWGIETPKDYIENFRSFQKAITQFQEHPELESDFSGLLEKMKEKIYSKSLLDWTTQYQNFKDGKQDIAQFTSFLREQKISIQDPQLKKFLDLTENIKKTDEDKLRKEFLEITQTIQQKLSLSDLKKWVGFLLLARLGKIDVSEYHQTLLNHLKTLHIPLENFPHFLQAIRLEKQMKSISLEAINQKLEDVSLVTINSLLKEENEIELWHFESFWRLARRAIQLKITRSEWETLDQISAKEQPHLSPALLKKSGLSQNQIESLNDISETLSSCLKTARTFYEQALKRDQSLMQNFDQLLKKQKPKAVVLITGGFHSNSIAQKLKKENLSFWVVKPKITLPLKDDIYWKLMMDERLKVFPQHALAFPSVLNPLLELLGHEAAQSFQKVIMGHFVAWLCKNGIKPEDVLKHWSRPNIPTTTEFALIQALKQAVHASPDALPAHGLTEENVRELVKLGEPVTSSLQRYLEGTGETGLLGILRDATADRVTAQTPEEKKQPPLAALLRMQDFFTILDLWTGDLMGEYPVKIAEALNKLKEVGFIDREEVHLEDVLPLLISNLRFADGATRLKRAETLVKLIEGGFVRSEQIKTGDVLPDLIMGLKSPIPLEQIQNAQTLALLIKGGLITKDQIDFRVVLTYLMDGLEQIRDGVLQGTSTQILIDLLQKGFIKKEDIDLRDVLPEILEGLGQPYSAFRILNARTLEKLAQTGLIGKQDIDLTGVLPALIAGIGPVDTRKENAQVLTQLIRSGLIDEGEIDLTKIMPYLITGLRDPVSSQACAELFVVLIRKGWIKDEKDKSDIANTAISEWFDNDSPHARDRSCKVLAELADGGLIKKEQVNLAQIVQSLINGLPVYGSDALVRLAKIGWLSKREIVWKNALTRLIAGLADHAPMGRVENAKILAKLALAGLIGKDEIDSINVLPGLMSVLIEYSANHLMKLKEVWGMNKEVVRGMSKEALMDLYDHLDSRGLTNHEKALVLQNITFIDRTKQPEAVRRLSSLMDQAEINSKDMEILANTMVWFSHRGSSDAQNALEGRIERILQKKPKDGSFIFISGNEHVIINATLKSFTQRTLLPFVWRKDIPTELRLEIIKGLSERGMIDETYGIFFEGLSEARIETRLNLLTQIHEALKSKAGQDFVPPVVLIDAIEKGQLEIRSLMGLEKKITDLEKARDHQPLVQTLAHDENLLMAYYCLRNSPYRYPGTKRMSYQRFRHFIKEAANSLVLIHPAVTQERLRISLIGTGVADDRAQQMVDRIDRGGPPLSDDSTYLDKGGDFITQEVDVLMDARGDETERAEENFEKAKTVLIHLLRIGILSQKISKGLEDKGTKSLVVDEEQRSQFRAEHDRILDQLNQTGIAGVSDALDQLIALNFKIYTKAAQSENRELELARMHQEEIDRWLKGELTNNYGKFWQNKEEKGSMALSNLSVSGVLRGTKSVVKRLSQQRKGRRLSEIERAWLGNREVKPEDAVRLLWLGLKGRTKLGQIESLYDEILGDLIGSFDNYSNAIHQQNGLSEGKGIPQKIYIRHIHKANLWEALRFSDGAHSCNSSDTSVSNQYGQGIYEDNAHRWLIDSTTLFYELSTQPEGGEQIGFLKYWIGIGEDGQPFIGSNYLYLAPSYQNEALHKAVLTKLREIFFSAGFNAHAMPDIAHTPANAMEPPTEYKHQKMTVTRLQSLEDGWPIKADGKLPDNQEVQAKFFVFPNPNSGSAVVTTSTEKIADANETVANIGNAVDAKVSPSTDILSKNEAACEALTQRIFKETGLLRSDRTEIFYGEARYKNIAGYIVDPGASADSEKMQAFIRIGPLFIIEEDFYCRLSPVLQQDLGNNVIRLKALHQDISRLMYGSYTLATIVMMLNSDFSGKRVVDAGAGTGILSIVAMKLGAAFVDLVDYDQDELIQAHALLELNGFTPEEEFLLHVQDLRKPDEILKALSPYDGETAVISHIGTHPGLYKVTNADSIRLASRIPRVTLFVGGGYEDADDFSEARSVDQDLIRPLGFKVQSVISEFADSGVVITAWSATRKAEGTQSNPAPLSPEDITKGIARADLEAAPEVLKNYDIGDIKSITPTSRGVGENGKALIVETAQGKYVLKPSSTAIYPELDDSARYEISVVNHLIQKGFPAAAVIRTKKTNVSQSEDAFFVKASNGKIYILHQYMEGESIGDAALSKNQTRALVDSLAAMHKNLENFEPAGKRTRSPIIDFDVQKERLKQLRENVLKKKRENAQYSYTRSEQLFLDNIDFILQQITILETQLSPAVYRTLPQTIVHGDLHPGNVVFQTDRVMGVFDWDHLRREARIYDFFHGLFPDSKDNHAYNVEGLATVILRYHEQNPLTDKEIEALPEIARLKFIDLVSWFVRIEKLSERHAHDFQGIDPLEQALSLLDRDDGVFHWFESNLAILRDIDARIQDRSFSNAVQEATAAAAELAKNDLTPLIQSLPIEIRPIFEEALKNIRAKLELSGNKIHLSPALIKFLSILGFLGTPQGDMNAIRAKWQSKKQNVSVRSSKIMNKILWQALFQSPDRLKALYDVLEQRGEARAFRDLMRQVMPVTREVFKKLIDLDVPVEFFIIVLSNLTSPVQEDPSLTHELIAKLARQKPQILHVLIQFPAERARKEFGIEPEGWRKIQEAA